MAGTKRVRFAVVALLGAKVAAGERREGQTWFMREFAVRPVLREGYMRSGWAFRKSIDPLGHEVLLSRRDYPVTVLTGVDETCFCRLYAVPMSSVCASDPPVVSQSSIVALCFLSVCSSHHRRC